MLHLHFLLVMTTLVVGPVKAIMAFPFGEFWNMSDSEHLKNLLRRNSCFNGDEENRCCECNDSCMQYGTCCIDKLWHSTMQLQQYLSFFMKRSAAAKNKMFECRNPFPFVPSGSHMVGNHTILKYLMVASCLPGANDDDRNACSNGHGKSLQFSLPVVGEDKVIYKNLFCARCNLVRQFEPVDMKVTCPERGVHGIDTTGFDIFRNIKEPCTLAIDNSSLPGVPLKVCRPEPWERRCQKDEKTYDECEAYVGMYQGYPNYHCWRCHAHVLHNSSKDCPLDLTLGRRGPVPVFASIYFLLVLSTHSRTDGTQVSKGKPIVINLCKEGTIHDIVEKKCVPYRCPTNYQLVNSRCVNVLSSFTEVNESQVYTCLLKNGPSLFLAYHTMNTTHDHVLNIVYDVARIPSHALVYFTEEDGLTIVKIKKEFIDPLMRALPHVTRESREFLEVVKWFIITSYDPIITSKVEFTRTFPSNRLCAEYALVDVKFVNFTSSCGITYKNEIIKRSNLSMSIAITKHNATQHLAYCKRFYMQPSTCPLDNLTSGIRYGVDGSLIHSQKDGESVAYPVEKYFPLKNGAGICMNAEKKAGIEMMRYVIGYVSFSGHLLSCVCHVLVLLTFGAIEEEFPGFGLVSLCVTLFLSDILLLITISLHAYTVDVSPRVCKMIGMAIHFGLLSVQACGVVSSVDLFKQLGQAIIIRSSHHTAKEFFRHRAIVMFFLPLLVVIGAMLLDLNKIVETGYGDDGLCLFSGFYGRLFFYIIPSIITFIISASLISYTVYKVSAICRENKKALHGTGSRHLSIPLIALKLVLTYGISEGIGFVQIPRPISSEHARTFNHIFEFLYTFLRSFRGCIIFFIYVCRKTVLAKYKDLFSRLKLPKILDRDAIPKNLSNIDVATDNRDENAYPSANSHGGNQFESTTGDRAMKMLKDVETDAIVHTSTGVSLGDLKNRVRSASDARRARIAFATETKYASIDNAIVEVTPTSDMDSFEFDAPYSTETSGDGSTWNTTIRKRRYTNDGEESNTNNAGDNLAFEVSVERIPSIEIGDAAADQSNFINKNEDYSDEAHLVTPVKWKMDGEFNFNELTTMAEKKIEKNFELQDKGC